MLDFKLFFTHTYILYIKKWSSFIKWNFNVQILKLKRSYEKHAMLFVNIPKFKNHRNT